MSCPALFSPRPRLEAEADPSSFNRHTNPFRPASPRSFSISFWTRRLSRSSNVFTLLLAACQFGLSYDNGANFYVIKSYMGGCPSSTTSFDVEIPSDAPSGTGVMCVTISSFQWSCGRREDVKTDEKSASPSLSFSWSWFNKVGNREMYQNCLAAGAFSSCYPGDLLCSP